MKVLKREQEIIGILETRGEISAKELSQIVGCSLSTLRKQLAIMESNGLVIRTYGGVMSVNRVRDESFDSKMHKNSTDKHRIAEKARSLIPAGSSIALGSGSSVYSLGTLLGNVLNASVYTNSMQAAEYLSHCPGVEIHICGGIVRGHTGTIIGNEVADYFRNLKQVDFAFIGCDAIDSNGDVYNDNLSVATAEKSILLCAKHKYILCDSSKFGKTSVAHMTNLSQCDGLITCSALNGFAERYEYITNVIYT